MVALRPTTLEKKAQQKVHNIIMYLNKLTSETTHDERSKVRIRHRKNRKANMTKDFENRAKDRPETYTGCKNVGDHGFEKKNKEADFIEPTTDPLQTWAESYSYSNLYGYCPKPGTTFAW